MSEYKHTPGPWQVVRCNPRPTSGEVMIRGSKPGYLAEVRDCGSGDVDANARLIAAAPDLLEALQEMLIWAEDSHVPGKTVRINFSGMDMARDAVAKALGSES